MQAAEVSLAKYHAKTTLFEFDVCFDKNGNTLYPLTV